MTSIHYDPRKMQDGTAVSWYYNTVGTEQDTYTFPTPQEYVKIVNKGTSDIEYVLGGYSGVLKPSETIEKTGAFSSFSVRSTERTQAFEIISDEEGSTIPTGGGSATIPSNVVYFESLVGGTSVSINAESNYIPPVEEEPPTGGADTSAPILTITPASTFSTTQNVTMSTNETASIYYTLDDSDPKVSGTRLTYTAPITLSETDTVKAYAVDSAGNESAVQTITYTKQAATSLFSDNFNRADGGIGSNWSFAGTAQVINNQVGFTANYTSFPNIDKGVSDNISVEMDLVLPTLFTGNISGIAVRMPSASNAQAILFGAKTDGTKLGFLSTLTGTSALPADVNFTFVVGQTYRLKVEITGNVYKCYVDDVLKFTYTDTNSIGLTNTKHGFCFYNTTVPRGDNFEIKPL